jgi:CheY-like chemotaxis protein
MIVRESALVQIGPGRHSRASQFASLLQEFYEDLLESGVPERLAALVQSLPDRDEGEPRGTKRIAIVAEGDDDARALAATLLEETDLAVVECTSAEAALTILQREGERVAFVFADEELAGPRDGRDLARSATTLWPHVHVVITTSAPAPDFEELLPEGVRALRKPWRGLDVLLAAERALAAAEPPSS